MRTFRHRKGAAVIAFLLPCPTHAFLASPPLPSTKTVLSAKKKRSVKKSTKPQTGGGFGAPPAVVQKQPKDDYAVFPRLEPQVLETLVAATNNDVMNNEMYQRLAQIYGFHNFNYEVGESASSETSLSDLLSMSNPELATSDKSLLTTTPLTSSSTNNDLDDLLAAATGGVPTSATKLQSPPPSPTDLSEFLDPLPPFDNVKVLHVDPMVLLIEDFFTLQECQEYIEKSQTSTMSSQSPTVGKDAAARAQRTSTTFYHYFRDVPEFLAKAARLLGLSSIDCLEEPQTVRYQRKEQFSWHLDAIGPNEIDSSGQRVATLLVYLTELEASQGGATLFRDLNLRVQPKRGSALLFFPSAGGLSNPQIDIRTLHCGQVVAPDADTDKWIAQVWVRQFPYRPTAPPGNKHADATLAIQEYCERCQAA